VDRATNTDSSDRPTGPGAPEVNQLIAAVSLSPLTDDFMNESVAPVPHVCGPNHVFPSSVATSLCCPVAQLSTLTYIDITVRCNENGPSITTRALADTGAQISVIKSELLDGFEMEIKGKIKL